MRRCAVVLALLLLGSIPLHARSLHWTSIDVEAKLDRDGVLEVAETQAYVFDGDWNGGERTFNVRHMQSLDLLGVDRIDGENVIPLKSGGLENVDRYHLNREKVLRWRSRLPTDPPFENTQLTYRIRYRLRGVLRGRNGEYRLDHDFLFPDRSGMVQRFSLRLQTDPSWKGIEPVLTRNARNVIPGEGYVVTRDLTWNGGSRQPASVTELPSPFWGRAVIALIAIGFALFAFRFFVHERNRGRFGGLTPASEIDDAWLEANVFAFSPEAIGAAWDGKVGAPEVAAVIASLAQDKKIETSVEKRWFSTRLKMRLLVDRDDVRGYHGVVVDKLFFNDRKETDTDVIRRHYRSTGLDLASIIRNPVELELARTRGWNSTEKAKINWMLNVGWIVGSVVLAIVIAAVRGGNDAALVATTLFFGVIAAVGSPIAAKVSSDALTRLVPRLALVFAFMTPLMWLVLSYLSKSSEYLFGVPAMLACASFVLAVVNLVFILLRSEDSAQKIAFRKRIISVRRYFLGQLSSAEPRLRDEWFPYLLAVGLGKNVENWFRSYGTDRTYESYGTDRSYTSSTSGPTSSGSSWTGGGGSFGGAGATGSWALAAAAVGAGVSAPSRGGSGGGGGSSSSGGGGGSSGGGGGGGW